MAHPSLRCLVLGSLLLMLGATAAALIHLTMRGRLYPQDRRSPHAPSGIIVREVLRTLKSRRASTRWILVAPIPRDRLLLAARRTHRAAIRLWALVRDGDVRKVQEKASARRLCSSSRPRRRCCRLLPPPLYPYNCNQSTRVLAQHMRVRAPLPAQARAASLLAHISRHTRLIHNGGYARGSR